MADIKAGGAYVELGVKDAVDKGLKAASAKLKKWGKSVGVVGAAFSAAGTAVLAPLTAAAASFAAAGDQLSDMSARTGFAIESLSELSFAAQMSGTSIEELEVGLKKMAKEAAKSGKNPEQAFAAFANEIAAIQNPLKRAVRAQEIFGKAGTKLIPLLAGGASGLRAMTAEAEKLGIVMSTEDARAAAEFDDAMNRVKATVAGVKNQIGASLVPTLVWLAESFTSAMKIVIPFVKENRSIIATVATAAAAVVGFGSAIVVLGAVMAASGVVIGGVASVLAFLMNPITLVIGGLAALGSAFFYYSGYAGDALDWLAERFGPLITAAQDAAAIILDAFSSGDLSEAWDTALMFAETAWLDLTNNLMTYWDTAMNYVTEITAAVAKAIGKAFEFLGQSLQTMLDGYAAYYDRVWNTVTEKLGELNGVRTIGGDVGAFQQDFGGLQSGLTEAFSGIEQFGATMQEVAESNRQASLRDVKARDYERSQRLDRNREELAQRAKEVREKPSMPDTPDYKLPDFGSAADEPKSRGTFSSVGALFLGGTQTVQERQLKELEMIRKTNTDMAKNDRKQRLAMLG